LEIPKNELIIYGMKKLLPFLLLAAGSLWAAPLPLSLDLYVRPEGRGSLTGMSAEWRWSERLSSLVSGTLQSYSLSEDLEGYGPGALYVADSKDGRIAVQPLVFDFSWMSLDLGASAGLGLKTEAFTERGDYESVGLQRFDNEVSDWRVGLILGGKAAGRLGPVSIDYRLEVWAFELYVLKQIQTSTLIAPEGRLDSVSFIGPEIDHSLKVSAFDWFWGRVDHEFLWLSAPALAQNEAGDGWTSVIEGRSNQLIRLVAGLRLPLPSGGLELGAGRKQVLSGGNAESAVIESDWVFELDVKAGL
jgi:hypothetical protein